MIIVKANGQKEPFSEEKILQSARRAGVPKEALDDMLEHIKNNLYDGMRTSEIYQHILEYLTKNSHFHSKAQYSLKQAIMDLGPTGYPFEDYVARILQEEGYMTSVRNVLRGKCVTHEVDVVAEQVTNGKKRIMVEAKFHNKLGIKTDVHVPMYTWARFQDLLVNTHFDEVLLITNTKATTDAIAYAECMGMRIISWEHPHQGNLMQLVQKHALHPVTTLTSLSLTQKQMLLEKGTVLCKDICQKKDVLKDIFLSDTELAQVYEESLIVCSLEQRT